MTIKHFLLNSFGGSKCVTKMAISAHVLKILENNPFLRLQMTTKEMFNCHHFFYTNKQYLKIKLMQMRQICGVVFW